MKKQFIMGMVAILLMFGLVTNSSAAPLLNGSFELPDIGTSSFFRVAPSDWSVGIVAGLVLKGTFYGVAPQDGNQYYAVGNTPAYLLSQIFTITAAGDYQLAWYDNIMSQSSTAPYSVSITGISSNPIYSGSATGSTSYAWTSKESGPYYFSTGDYTLTFTCGNGRGFDLLLDNVSLTLTSTPPPTVPIPGALILFGSGLLGLAGIRKKIKS